MKSEQHDRLKLVDSFHLKCDALNLGFILGVKIYNVLSASFYMNGHTLVFHSDFKLRTTLYSIVNRAA